ncbi:HNH endonuclease superfamily protein [Psychroflexus torquis ATCC 700755]|uniref:HNH endonuclease superfamily protein n=1 Tax=Psychroflexus torquis (strain ATCC 700755 / CIP 106069 / ACAM 623) TaxID=313595 RepID=K4IIA1_PSYTT|nr:HNH endonuclease signature motif containing protein [Psychroflexus torquis]AFU69528.1 HNH endonuclease superfamily protein [Psychroflexus torquis ATCC 700755]
MNKRTLNTFLSRGFPTDLIDKIDKLSLTYSALNNISKKTLIKIGFDEKEALIIHTKTGRNRIEKEVIKSLIEKSGGCCCFCENGINNQPYQIHHIEEYHLSQNNNESNLLVVCPTHHFVIHSEKISQTEQIIKKNKWSKIWEISKEYNNKQLSYPFKSFSIIDYIKEGTLAEVLSFSISNSNLCESLTFGTLADNAYSILLKTNTLILAGNSGSGKSTFSLGIAGKFKTSTVLKYEPKIDNKIEDILNLISFTVNESILIIDDANLYFSSNEIEKILNATTKKLKIIITFTSGTVDEGVENHFPLNSIFLSWPELEIRCKQYFLDKEELLINYLNENNINNFDNNTIGFSFPSITLQNLFDSFSNRIDKIKTVWEFIYLLSNGHSKIDNISTKLYAKERLDIVVFFCSVVQIGNIDSGVTISEVQTLYRENNILNLSSEPEQKWLLTILDKLCYERILKTDRGRYKTIHRKFAQNFIESFSFKHPEEADNILKSYLDKQTNAKPIVILWSWLKLTSAKFIIPKWLKSKGYNFHINFISKCAEEDFAILTNYLSLIEHSIQRDKVVFEKIINLNIEGISSSMNNYNEPIFYYHGNLYRILKQNVNSIAEQVFKKLDINIFTDKIKIASPNEYFNLNWMFNSLIEINSDIVKQIAEKLSFSDCLNTLTNVESGNVSNIEEVIIFYRRYILRFKRSYFHKCIQIIISKTSNSSYSSLNFPYFYSGLTEFIFIKKEIKAVLKNLDFERLTKELVCCTPRDWNNIGVFLLYTNLYYPEYSKNFIDLIDLPKLDETISKYYKMDRYNFRCLIHFLGCSSSSKKKKISKFLLPLINDLLTNSLNKYELKEILKAFYKIDKIESIRLSTEFKISISFEEDERNELPNFDDSFNSNDLSTDYFLDDYRKY